MNMDTINGFEILYEQNGGSEKSYEFDDSVDEDDTLTSAELAEKTIIECQQNKRSYVLTAITPDIYTKINENIKWLRDGNGKTSRDGGLKVQVYHPGEEINFDSELIVIDNYMYPDKTVSYSSLYTRNIISETEVDPTKYYLFGIDMIWCRENTLSKRLVELLK